MKIAITGATGFLGRPLVAALRARGDAVTVLTRDPAHAQGLDATIVQADLEAPGPWQDALAGHDAIVHLAGASIAGTKWDARGKQIIRDSRVETTRTLVEGLAKLPAKPRVLVTASGIDYYPYAIDKDDFDDDPVTEKDPPSDSFLGRLCRDWEREATAAEGVRVVRMRTGVVLGKGGGALDKLVPLFRKGLGGKLGSGRQWFSWIHRDDVIAAYVAALDDDRYTGPVNLVAPQSTRYAAFAKALGAALHRPSFFRVPAFALRIAAGELSEALLHGRRAIPAKLDALGFPWRHATLESSLAEWRQSSS